MKTSPPYPSHEPKQSDPSDTSDQAPFHWQHSAYPNSPRTVDSRELLGDQVMVQIRHMGEIYRLQTTRQGKLILTK